MFFPYQFDVPMYRWPIANFLMMAATIVVTVLAWLNPASYAWLVLDGWNISGMLGANLLHAGPVHLAGNMIFLWVFGNVICAKLGNIQYLIVYFLLAIASSSVHNIMSGGTAIGASGVINGIVGLALVWYPANSVSCAWFFFYRGGTFDIDCRWLVLIWLGFDIFGVVSGGEGVGYWAHLGGLGAGIGLGIVLLKQGWVVLDDTEHSIFEVLGIGEPQSAATSTAPAGGDVPAASAGPTSAAGEFGAGTATASTASTATQTRPSDRIKIRCRCGARFRVPKIHVGKTTRCPKCDDTLHIEG